MLSASVDSPNFFKPPLAPSMPKVTTRNGCERSATYKNFLSLLTAIGMAVPPTGTLATGVRLPAARSSCITEMSWLSALAM